MQASAEKIWGSAQQSLRSLLNADTYNLWFAPIRARSLDGDCLTLEVANDFCEVWLEKNYLDLIREKLIETSGQLLKVKFETGKGHPAPASIPVLTPAPAH